MLYRFVGIAACALCLSPGAQSADLFVDATATSGIEFTHFNGFTGRYMLPEIAGAGGALFDYDNDGDLDLYVVQGARLNDAEQPPGLRWLGDGQPGDRLFRNDLSAGKLRFTDVTEASGIAALGFGMGVAAGDYNNDGWIDLYVTNVGSNYLLRNNGDGTFDDVAAESGCDDRRWSTSASFVDYDSDGRLDLFVSNYVDFSIKGKVECFARTSAPDYCGPDAYKAVADRLFHNRGDGTFEDVTESAGIAKAYGAGLGVVAADFNDDGLLDLYAADDGDPNQLWVNQADGTFSDEAMLSGLALNAVGMAEASMGVDVADIDGDGDLDVFMTHLDGESNTLYLNVGDGFFEDSTIQVGLHAASLPYTGFGTRFFDYDNDGWLDLLILNGAVRLQDRQFRQGDSYPLEQPNQLFHNDGKGLFVEVSAQAGDAFAVEEVSRGAAAGDVDNDGDIDVVIFNNSGPAKLLLNQIGSRKNWLGLRLLLSSAGRDALHSRVEIKTSSGRTLWRRVQADGSYLSANDPRVLVGLGDDESVEYARVYWNGGDVEEWTGLQLGRYTTLIKGESPPKQ